MARSNGPARMAGAALLVFGIMFVFIGVILLGLCLPMGGLLCQDTGIGTIGTALFGIGVVPLILGVLLLRVGRRAAAARLAAQPQAALVNEVLSDELRVQQQMMGRTRGAASLARQPLAGEPVALKCPDCGAPVPEGAKVCGFCGQTFA